MISGPSQVEIGSKSGPGGGVQLGRCQRGRSGWEGPCSSSESPHTNLSAGWGSSRCVVQPVLPGLPQRLETAAVQLACSGRGMGFALRFSYPTSANSTSQPQVSPIRGPATILVISQDTCSDNILCKYVSGISVYKIWRVLPRFSGQLFPQK